ncbi:MAG: hypothetical protein J1E97_01255 [Muribaculaceae bacterium]|nr:hypothetical protein [Muribaculaceae bacterium]
MKINLKRPHAFASILMIGAINVCMGATHHPTAQDEGPLRHHSFVDIQEDSLRANHKIIYIDGKPVQLTEEHLDSVRRMIDMFYFDQFRNFSDPAAPYFLFMSKDAQLAMGVGGCVRMRAWYDWGGAIPANGFAPYLIPMEPDPTNMRKFGTTPSGSTLFFRVIGRNKKLGDYQLYIEANFNGYGGKDFHLKKAYASINDWTIGYASTTFSDPAALPPTVDASGPNNKLSSTSVLVRYMHNFGKHWTLATSVETPASAMSLDENTKKVTDWLPDFAAFMQYAWGRSEHIRLAGIVRTLSYRDLLQKKNFNKVGWGLLLSGVVHPIPQLTAYGNVCYGQGYESLCGDLQIGNYDLVAMPDGSGKMYAPFALGWNLGVQYNILPNLFASLTFSESRYFAKEGTDGSEYKWGNFLAANVFWNITPRIQCGLEFDTGERKNIDGRHRRAQRVGAMAQFSF